MYEDNVHSKVFWVHELISFLKMWELDDWPVSLKFRTQNSVNRKKSTYYLLSFFSIEFDHSITWENLHYICWQFKRQLLNDSDAGVQSASSMCRVCMSGHSRHFISKQKCFNSKQEARDEQFSTWTTFQTFFLSDKTNRIIPREYVDPQPNLITEDIQSICTTAKNDMAAKYFAL